MVAICHGLGYLITERVFLFFQAYFFACHWFHYTSSESFKNTLCNVVAYLYF